MTAEAFEVAWEAAAKIDGWLDTAEAHWLYDCACKVNGLIVEVGAYHGRSAVLFAHTDNKIVTIDPLRPKDDKENNMLIVEEDYLILARNISPYNNIIWMPEILDRIPLQLLPDRISMLYIDANHIYPHPKQDFEYLQPLLANEVFVAFHDYGFFEGVTQSCNELEKAHNLLVEGTANSMRIYKYRTNTSPDKSIPSARKP